MAFKNVSLPLKEKERDIFWNGALWAKDDYCGGREFWREWIVLEKEMSRDGRQGQNYGGSEFEESVATLW